MAQIDRILVPVDGSEGSGRAAHFAADLAMATGATVTLMHVVQLTSSEVMGLRSLDSEEIETTLQRMAQPTLEAAGRAMGAPAHPLNLDEVVGLGHPADEILAWASQNRPSLIIMGSRGLSPLREILLGSVSEKVVRRAACPVTISR